jgi:hypothetical protein
VRHGYGEIRGVMPQPHCWDELWIISVQHSEVDIDKQLAAFEDVAPALANAQQARTAEAVTQCAAHEVSC